MAELFELKKVAVIPHDTPAGMEQRHELMISMIRDRLYSTDKYAKIINKDKAIKNKKEWRVRTSVHQLTPLKFNTWYYHPIRKPWKDCKHEYLMNIFEEALSNAGSYLYNGEHGPNYNIDINGWTKMCFITPK